MNKTYQVTATKTIHLTATVEATSAEEALEIVDRDFIIDDFKETNSEFKFTPYQAVEMEAK